MEKFDVFLCHNSKDKPAVILVAEQLKQRGISPWLDIWHLRPGLSWQNSLEEQIDQIRAAAIFVGNSGFGPWQDQEINAFLREFVYRKCPVIPVLLQDAPQEPKLPVFLRGLVWVDFSLQYPEPMEQLIWGITGEKLETTPIIQPTTPKTDNLDSEKNYTIPREPPPNPPQENLQTETKITSTPTPTSLPLNTARRPFLKWAGWGSVGLVTSVVGREILIKLNQSTECISLESERGIDYTKLCNLLDNKKWKEADSETYKVMNKALNERWSSETLLNFPCKDLRTIDSLWVKYSNGHFGFSVQKKIYLSVGGKADGEYYQEVWDKFGDRVGWRVNSSWIYYKNVTFDTSALKGHLPVGEQRIGMFSSLASRLVNCNI
ncbi:GUN4 domain-containing protein [Nostoc sp.]|uniref:GUN4 domain-containing protein n=1 Tax=Nostoc sp. TaxID=1180 RepID=UPI002FF84552